MRDGSSTTNVEQETAAEALRDGFRSIRETLAYVQLLVSATLDRWKLSALMLGLYAVLAVFGAAAGIAVVISAVVLLMVGIAHGVGALLGGRDWLGDLVVGFVVLAGLTIGVTSFLERFVHSSKRRTASKYEKRHARQRQTFGHDVSDRTTSPDTFSPRAADSNVN